MSTTLSPLILTLTLEQVAFERLDSLRREHFPLERNVLPAHLTLSTHYQVINKLLFRSSYA